MPASRMTGMPSEAKKLKNGFAACLSVTATPQQCLQLTTKICLGSRLEFVCPQTLIYMEVEGPMLQKQHICHPQTLLRDQHSQRRTHHQCAVLEDRCLDYRDLESSDSTSADPISPLTK